MEVDWYCPAPIVKLALKPGTRVLTEIVDEEEVIVVDGTVCTVQEGVWMLQKPNEVQGMERESTFNLFILRVLKGSGIAGGIGLTR